MYPQRFVAIVQITQMRLPVFIHFHPLQWVRIFNKIIMGFYLPDYFLRFDSEIHIIDGIAYHLTLTCQFGKDA